MSGYQELIDSKGRRFSRQDLFVAMCVTTTAGSIGSVWIAMTNGMPVVMFMQSIGASGLLIGVVTTVRQLTSTGQIAGALFSERLESRKFFWFCVCFACRAVWFLVAALACWRPHLHWLLPFGIVCLITTSDLLGNASAAPWYSWMADLIPLPISGRFWGIRQTMVTLAALCGLVITGQVLDAWRDPNSSQATPRGFAIVFLIAACLGVTDVIVHWFVREPKPGRPAAGVGLMKRILTPLANRDFLLLTLSIGAWNFGYSMISAFSFVYLKRDFGVSYSQLAALGIASSLGVILTCFGFGEVMDRVGARRFGAAMFLIIPLTQLAWLFIDHTRVVVGPFIFPQSIALLSVTNVVSGGICMAITLCQLRLAAELSSPQGRTMSMGVHWGLVGILSALGPTAGGLVMDHFPAPSQLRLEIFSGLPFSFYHAQLTLFAGILWLLALPLLLAIREKSPRIDDWSG